MGQFLAMGYNPTVVGAQSASAAPDSQWGYTP